MVIEWVSARRVELIQSEGARIKAYLSGQANSLNTMLSDTEIARLDILRLETQLYEQAAGIGKMADAANLAKRKLRVPRGQQAWPFQGEFWADELGYFRVTATPQCPQSLMVGTQKN